MPGPFPGMDPYLENVRIWRGVHHGLIFCIASAINQALRPRYTANIDTRLYVVQPQRSVFPDVLVSCPLPVSSPRLGSASRARGDTAAVAERETPPHILTVEPEPVREGFIEIRSVEPPRRLVTVIEILSHTNKAAKNEGRAEYLKKQEQLLCSDIHLLEIDLLRSGLHTVAVPEESLRWVGEVWDYLVCLHRGATGPTYEYWPIRIRERLPRVRVPLAEDDPDMILDLQVAFDRCYDEGPYADEIDYRAAPALPLDRKDAAWANALLRKKGLRE